MFQRSTSKGAAALGLALFALAPLSAAILSATTPATETKGSAGKEQRSEPQDQCSIDLSQPGQMSDIVSNAIQVGLKLPVKETELKAFLEDARSRYSTGQELLEASARKYGLTKEALTAEVEKYRHCNCSHAPLVKGQITAGSGAPANRPSGAATVDAGSTEVTKFAKDVTLHVVLHELAHALVREFDLPVLANEETLADAFATYYLTTYMPDRAFDVIRARTQSLMIEAGEVPRVEWSVNGEHNSDARRAFQIAGIAVAADSQKYGPIAEEVGMSDSDIANATDYGSEIHRSWRRLLRDYRMPEGMRSSECYLRLDKNSKFIDNLCSDGLTDELRGALCSFDWHSTVTIHFTDGEGGAFWSRSKRTITVNREYVQRFVAQGKLNDRRSKER